MDRLFTVYGNDKTNELIILLLLVRAPATNQSLKIFLKIIHRLIFKNNINEGVFDEI